MVTTIGPWIYFNIFVVVMLLLDLIVVHRKSHVVSTREALGWSAFWIALALIFNVGIYIYSGYDNAITFLTGYLIEKSLSVDNLFVFLMLFNYFHTPKKIMHKALFWGIFGAIIMRAVFIALGITLITYFEQILYVFGVFLVYVGIKMALQTEQEEIDPKNNPVLKLTRRLFRITDNYVEDHFFTRQNGTLWATPLFVVLIAIETTDVIFALDSIPAILAITRDPFIVYTSNIFAILGLRSLFFALSNLMPLFHYLHYALSFILTFIGVKMLIEHWVHIPPVVALIITATALVVAVIGSLLNPKEVKK